MKKFISALILLAPVYVFAGSNNAPKPDDIVPPENYTTIKKDITASEAFPDESPKAEISRSTGNNKKSAEGKTFGESYFNRGFYKQQTPR